MSGEPLVLLPGEAMVPLVRAAAKVADAHLGSYAVIGGVAVSARLGQAHRATSSSASKAGGGVRSSTTVSVGGLDKRAGDAWDMYRILLDLDSSGEVRNELSALPAPIRQVVADTAERIFIGRAARTVSWLKAGDERMASITAEELQALGQPVIDAVRNE